MEFKAVSKIGVHKKGLEVYFPLSSIMNEIVSTRYVLLFCLEINTPKSLIEDARRLLINSNSLCSV